jgi:hypothetical protein
MVYVCLHVDHRDVRPFGKAFQNLLARTVDPVDRLAEAANGDAMTHPAEHAGHIDDRLDLLTSEIRCGEEVSAFERVRLHEPECLPRDQFGPPGPNDSKPGWGAKRLG